MAKERAKKATARKRSRSVASKQRRQAVSSPTTKKLARAGDADHVSFGVHGMARIVDAVNKAGLASQFNDRVGKAGTFVKVQRGGMAKIKAFVESKPQLAGLANEMSRCNCPPDDPYCIYFLS